jgi:hypothetical protein
VAAGSRGVSSQEEFNELFHSDDAERIYVALDDLGYTFFQATLTVAP